MKNPYWEGIKELLRWVLPFVVTSLALGLQNQLDLKLIPPQYAIYAQWGVTLLVRFADKAKYVDEKNRSVDAKGLLRF